MDAKRHSCDHAEEDFIYMEVGSQSAVFSHHYSKSTSSSSSHAREFEFQMSSSSERDAAPSPADELFYKGKLLPLHLPPRLQMVEKLLQNANISSYDSILEDTCFEESFSTPLFTNAYNTPTANNTPFESCNISPSESCQVSRELNPEEYSFEYSTEASSFVGDQNPKRSWTKKLKLIKQSSLGSKLKASRTYLKSLFSKSACSNETCAAAPRNHVVDGSGSVLKANECINKYVKVAKKAPFGQIQNGGKKVSASSSVIKNFDKANFDENGVGGRGRHRRSFSGAIKRISIARSSSSLSSSGSSSASSSTNSNGFQELQFFKRSNSVNSDLENPIQAAIAHCKSSQQLFNSRKTVSDLGFCSLSSARVIYADQRPGLCRG
ncbi:probable membrane-associated kinase regulator 4 [Coffea arabica]|uniref:Probable membrane-associated kinase regulator 4 n=1 Tax=Coffea arabica TaxID=13443 RepID=A0A6P6VHF2_COFAR|nr:probable membrane-associated kinase regulator 4 [Coffea arabica]